MKLFILSPALLDQFQVRVLEWLSHDARIDVVGACVDTRPEKPRLQKVWRDLRKRRGGYVLVKGVNSVVHRRWQPIMAATDYLEAEQIPFVATDNLDDDETLAFMRSSGADCLFRAGFGIIREPVLSLAPKGVLSYHHGDIRRYRGTPVAFWELLRGEPELGVTVQILVPELDAGPIVHEITVPVLPHDSWRSLEKRAYALSDRMLLEACLRLDQPQFEPERVPTEDLGTLYTEPNLRQWASLQARVATRKLRGLARTLFSGSRRARTSRSS